MLLCRRSWPYSPKAPDHHTRDLRPALWHSLAACSMLGHTTLCIDCYSLVFGKDVGSGTSSACKSSISAPEPLASNTPSDRPATQPETLHPRSLFAGSRLVRSLVIYRFPSWHSHGPSMITSPRAHPFLRAFMYMCLQCPPRPP